MLKSGTLMPAVRGERTAIVLTNVRLFFQNDGRGSSIECGEGSSSPS